MTVESVIQLSCSCNQYPWGKQGHDSISARLCEKTPGWDGEKADKEFKIDDSKAYAEMWMGTYPVLPSYVKSNMEDLQKVIDKNAEQLIGKNVIDKFGHTNLPFLPKVLSIAKALPLQLHPNKELAAKLHKEDPQNFTDPNHKPEIALALSKFEAFCGFKPLERIEPLFKIDPLKQFVPEHSKFDDEVLKKTVNTMLKADEKTVASAVDGLKKLDKSSFGQDTYIPELIPRLAEQYDKTDNGILVALVTMNYLVLQAGEGIYIPADGIHAYLAGDIIECMARSDNVLNTGFCPQAERNSADLFTSTLTFKPHDPESCMLRGESYDRSKNGKTQVYRPPMSEFNMLVSRIGKGDKETLGAVNGPSILLVTEGKGKFTAKGKSYDVSEGNVFFIAQGTDLEIDAEDGLFLHTAYCE
ncbi:mannose-6-phosphate isomerase [Aureobasidium pullulans]|uniref:Mannose-6-phosphate isomerase n=1 Tax=Aureobasidium pullulans TaxID=5580 RepID=A0A4S9WE32_AURPU|nr:mannose-6-phosphate isomerase [Aureobasidium pullulans]THZ40458.1 mannose-6-phosphate isomerase [Aureobasidium pullulans]THZ62647.1 mannose-6-phosphate isomerase [Aureobasidium pullulans]THZ84242.1 mannose-6-phosphate isomerase [Aureobasidium pullulans]